jgi:hypothetical protein
MLFNMSTVYKVVNYGLPIFSSIVALTSLIMLIINRGEGLDGKGDDAQKLKTATDGINSRDSTDMILYAMLAIIILCCAGIFGYNWVIGCSKLDKVVEQVSQTFSQQPASVQQPVVPVGQAFGSYKW